MTAAPAIPSSTLDLGPVSDRIRAVREMAGLSQQDFAGRLGFSRRQVIAWETAANSPPISLLKAIRQCFNIDPEWVLMGPGIEPLEEVDRSAASKRQQVERDMARLVRSAGIEGSPTLVDNLVNMVIDMKLEDEKQAKEIIFRMLRTFSRGIGRGDK